ncbi:MAG TPA: YggT family protein [Pyrinomonadaceae bacterium]|nr:YggT family protein [Pyrinomonadaceae bacterium]
MKDLNIFFQIYLLLRYAVTAVVFVVILAMILRIIFNYTDPNPFGSLGKFSYWLKKKTDSLVRPAAGLLSSFRIDARIAPLLSILGICVVAYFLLQLIWNVLFTINGVVVSAGNGQIISLVGYLLYGLLAIYSLLIVIRIVFSWFMNFTNPLMRFLIRITEPILAPFRRIIPPIGMFDISPIILLFLLNFLQAAVYGVLISAPAPF